MSEAGDSRRHPEPSEGYGASDSGRDHSWMLDLLVDRMKHKLTTALWIIGYSFLALWTCFLV
ncbi:MAG: hypothetical protein ABSA29_16755 [Terriglobales bacterium]